MASLIPSIRSSLLARMEHLLSYPLIATIDGMARSRQNYRMATPTVDPLMDLQGDRYASRESRSSGPWEEDSSDGTATVQVQIDYDRDWSGEQGARAVLDAVQAAMDGPIACLTDYQLEILRKNPRDLLTNTNKEVIDLVGYKDDGVGRHPRVTALRLARAPSAAAAYTHLAVVPNLIQLERQLEALETLAGQGYEVLDPLRALVGAVSPERLDASRAPCTENDDTEPRGILDEHQHDCAKKALASPHFTLIKGPPGSGKTTVIADIVQRALNRGWRILIASSTHVAVDNIVEKLTKDLKDDDLAPCSTPVRFASRLKAVAAGASDYWVGNKQQKRIATIAHRVERVLCSRVPGASQLFLGVDSAASAPPPLAAAIAAHQPLICGTPIGILGCDEVSRAAPGSFDLLIVDEVSKMTVPEFLAVAVKARRWCLVGDPAQMPPFYDPIEVASTLTELVSDDVELVCSVAAFIDRTKPGLRSTIDLIVVADDSVGVERAIRDHFAEVQIKAPPPVQVYDGANAWPSERGVLVCSPQDYPEVLGLLRPHAKGRSPKVLLQRSLDLSATIEAPIVKEGERAWPASIETAYYTYHALPWSRERNHKLPFLGLRNGLAKYLPSLSALQALSLPPKNGTHKSDLAQFELELSRRFAIHCTSIYDWLAGVPTKWFHEVPILRRLAESVSNGISENILPFFGHLERQYRMHPSLSSVPRDLFYFGKSLRDSSPDDQKCNVRIMQVSPEKRNDEENANEVRVIHEYLTRLLSALPANGSVMIITPYRAQERALRDAIRLPDKRVDICTLDRCQGREADYVFLSLVRDSATMFLDMPKRWNVALTRARKGLFFVGNVDNYLREAREGRRQGETMKSSLLALILDSYDRLIVTRNAP